MSILIYFLSLLLLSSAAQAYTPSPDLMASPALLEDYVAWSARNSAFSASGSETRAFLDLVEILYDRDSNRPWGAEYFPEANRRLTQFRSTACKAISVPACFLPNSLLNDSDLTNLEQSLLEPATLAALGAHWNLVLVPWIQPAREPSFSLVAGALSETLARSASFWDLEPAAVSWRVLQEGLIADAATYVAGFFQEDPPAIYSVENDGATLNDFKLRDRAMNFAAAWKHAISANKGWPPVNPITDGKELQLQRMYDEQAADFARVYASQLVQVAGLPEVIARFQKERAAGDFPEETYQRVAYDQLRELVLTQGSYFALASTQRKNTSPRQQALESLLTLQRYSANPRAFALELTTLMEPLASHAFVLDEAANFPLAQTFVVEMLKALLGSESYADKPLFPTYGHGLLAPVLFQDTFLSENAPDVKDALAGRDFAKLDPSEQLKLLKLYLIKSDGKVRTMGVFRLAACWLSEANIEELHTLAERVHEVRKENFR